MYKVIIAVETEPVTLAEARLQLRMDEDNTVEDGAISALITAAREYAEHYTGLALAPQTLEFALDGFPSSTGFIDLPKPPVSSVTSIKYLDAAGVEQTLSSSLYSLSTYGDSRRINLASGQSWPATKDEPEAVKIRFATGYTDAPKAVCTAILLDVNLRYASLNPQQVEALEKARDASLNTVKLWGF